MRKLIAQDIQLAVAVVATIALAGCYVAPVGYGYSQPAAVYVSPYGGHYGGHYGGGYRYHY